MNEPFEGHGRWWLPNHPEFADVVFKGKLTWNPDEGATLEASGLDTGMWQLISSNQHTPQLICGQLDSIPCVTLNDALATSISLPIAGEGRAVFKSSRMAKGNKPVQSFESALFTTLACEITGLVDWVGCDSLKIEHKEKTTRIECMPYNTTQFIEIDGINLMIARWNKTSQRTRHFSAEAACSIELRRSEPFTYDQGREIIEIFKKFLTFVIDFPVFLTAIRGSIRNKNALLPNGKFKTELIEFYERADVLASRKSVDFKSEEVLLPFAPEERSAKAFEKFFHIYRSHPMAIDFFMAEKYGSKSFINQTFADMVHGLEGLHRGLRGGNFIEQEKYDHDVFPKLLAAIPSAIDQDLRASLKKRLEYGNEFSLRRRLKDLARFHKENSEHLLGKPSEFADTVATMRNALAHATAPTAPSRTTAIKYFVMLHRVRVLFQLELLHHLGFDSNYLNECCRRLKSAEIAVRKF